MRLTCPNCGAQYEVPDEVIPDSGRDVQCSNCGDTWFQHHPDNPPADEVEAEEQHPGWDSPAEEPETDFAPEEDETTPEDEDPDAVPEPPEADFAPEDDDAPEEVLAEDQTAAPEHPQEDDEEASGWDEIPDEDDSIEEVDDADEDEDAESDDAAARFEAPRRGLDPSIADVLREEAAREQEARQAETGGGLEMQPDLGLEETRGESGERSEQARARMARLRGLAEDATPETADPEPDPDTISRRNLLPDIDEINSSLESESVRVEGDHSQSDGAAVVAAARQSGFGKGFRRGVLLVIVLVLLYLLAPMISENIPAAAGAMAAYVDLVDSGRLWLSDWVASLTAGA